MLLFFRQYDVLLGVCIFGVLYSSFASEPKVRRCCKIKFYNISFCPLNPHWSLDRYGTDRLGLKEVC